MGEQSPPMGSSPARPDEQEQGERQNEGPDRDQSQEQEQDQEGSPADKKAMSPRSPAPQSSPSPARGPDPAGPLEADPESDLPIEPGSEPSHSDDGYESDAHSNSSTSLSSTVRDYVFENNRRYHKFKEGRYLIPNDEPEQEREDMKHAMIVNLCGGKLHVAPLVEPQRIIDIGTGTGMWAIDMGDEYPAAEIIGNDLSPIQPGWVPPNVRFQVDDAEADWLYGADTFDLVHARHVCMAIKDWPRLVRQAYDAIKPGGWIELQELRFVLHCDDGTMPSDYGYGKFVSLMMEGFSKFGINPLAMEKNPQLLTDGGFENVGEKVWKVPVGTWPKDPKMKTIGLYNRSMIVDALQAVSMAPLTRGLGWSAAQVEVFLVDVRKSLMDSSVHSYLTFHVVTGQKPLRRT